jgi:hypothetical protein
MKRFRSLCLILIFLLLAPLTGVFAQSTRPTIQIPIEAISAEISQIQLQTAKPIEIEIKKSSEATRMEGCKNLCGDGVCQEIVCMAIGCPCPETPETCPQDCKPSINETMEILNPVISLPTDAKVEINLAMEDPIFVNDKPIKFKGIESAVPIISTEVKTVTTTPTFTSTLNIEVDKENKTIKIENENISAITKENIKIEEMMLKIETPGGYIQVNVLPASAAQVVISKVNQEIHTTQLKIIDERPVYDFLGTKTGKFLWLIPFSFPIQTQVDAQSGEIIKIEKPWWSFLVS